MQLYTNSIQDRYGNALKGAQITVRTSAGDLATLYSDNGTTLAPNPLTADSTGEFAFYAANGRYSFAVGAAGMQSQMVSAFEMYDALELQAAVTAGAATAAANVVLTTADRIASAAAAVIATTKAGEAAADAAGMAGIASTAATQAGIATAKAAESATSAAGALAIKNDLQTNWGDKLATATAKAAESTTSAAASEVSRLASGVSAVSSASQVALATAAKTGAEAAQALAQAAAVASAVSLAANDTIALGRAAVADNAAFWVKPNVTDGLSRFTCYLRTSSTTQTFIADLVTGAELGAMSSLIRTDVPGYAFVLCDPDGKAAIGVKTDGTFHALSILATDLTVSTFNGQPVAALDKAATLGGITSFTTVPGYAFIFPDPAGNVSTGIKDDGTLATKSLEAVSLNGTLVSDILSGSTATRTPDFQAELVYINNSGQSLGQGAGGVDITIAQEYDSVGFTARVLSPTAYAALTVENTEADGGGECPMYGTLGFIKELIAKENALAYAANNYQLLASNCAYSGYNIEALRKGNAPYTMSMNHVQAGFNIAQAQGRTFKFQATTWTQGESNESTPRATHLADLIQLANDYDADGKAITGQAEDVLFVMYQTATVNRNVALAQLDAHEASSKIVMACPSYHLSYRDVLHIDGASSKWLGAYYGLVLKRMRVDGKPWEPLKPVSAVRQGTVLNVKFNTPVRPLVLDTSAGWIPAQVQHGFTLVTSGGVDIPIAAVSVIHADTVKVVASSTIPAGAKLRYGFNTAVGKGPFVGGCGNLRDSQGDTLVYTAIGKAMHNPCVIFEFNL